MCACVQCHVDTCIVCMWGTAGLQSWLRSCCCVPVVAQLPCPALQCCAVCAGCVLQVLWNVASGVQHQRSTAPQPLHWRRRWEGVLGVEARAPGCGSGEKKKQGTAEAEQAKRQGRVFEGEGTQGDQKTGLGQRAIAAVVRLEQFVP
jgi:hypothetical protein